jgi:hypothetical protein
LLNATADLSVSAEAGVPAIMAATAAVESNIHAGFIVSAPFVRSVELAG